MYFDRFETYLQPFSGAVRDLPAMVLNRECPCSFTYVAVHGFEVPRRVFQDLKNTMKVKAISLIKKM